MVYHFPENISWQSFAQNDAKKKFEQHQAGLARVCKKAYTFWDGKIRWRAKMKMKS